ncbi:phage virion morphogenesis protein [Vulcaniibacterium tengchongense]|uniref:Phage gpG-like protein n=1 Tax=Vulcaniibacterium tengchongense TaxID=1273429 RepID=A0A3N4VPN2_9GAMM|nr:phage virion morphogenesis protein [Vulcaniibacterium tengchongense]RPE81839.1 phage gpG-like protein [Vulcaniibacterium tengchongense]
MSDKPLIIEIDADRAQRWFGELQRRGQDLNPLMRDIQEYGIESTQRRFAEGRAPDGTPWVPLKSGSGRTPLTDTGRMRDGIHGSHGPTWAEISSDAKQARWHQEGTAPYVILPKSGKALAWEGGPGPRARVNHPGLPARPFIGLSVEDADYIDRLATAYLDLGDG